MARTPTAVSRTGPPTSPPVSATSRAGLRRTWAVLVGLLLSGAVCAGLLTGGAPAAVSVHRAINTVSGQAGGSAGTEQRQRTQSRRTQPSQSSRPARPAQPAQPARPAQPAQSAHSTQAARSAARAGHLIRPSHSTTATRGYAHRSGAAHPTAWAVSTDRPDPYVRAGHASIDRDRTGHAPAALGGTGVRAPPGPHAA